MGPVLTRTLFIIELNFSASVPIFFILSNCLDDHIHLKQGSQQASQHKAANKPVSPRQPKRVRSTCCQIMQTDETIYSSNFNFPSGSFFIRATSNRTIWSSRTQMWRCCVHGCSLRTTLAVVPYQRHNSLLRKTYQYDRYMKVTHWHMSE